MLNAVSLSVETLAAAFEQSLDCVKLLGLDGSVLWMNVNGQCAMEIDDFSRVEGQEWRSFWPAETQERIGQSIVNAASGRPDRFDAFCPTAKGSPRWWNVSVSRVEGADGRPSGYLAISRDITEVEKNRQALQIASAELQHRLKNTYAMIGSLLAVFARGNPDREVFVADMSGRLTALSVAQALFSTQEAPRGIRDLIPALVVPFDNPHCTVVVRELPDLTVDQGQADAIALVLGELAVNSTKHGAFAHGGAVDVAAHVAAGKLEIVWDERSTRQVVSHRRDGGQGLALIARIVRARDGQLQVEWSDAGPRVLLTFEL